MRKGQFSLKHYCISETGSVQSKTYAKTGRFAIRILLPHFSLGIAEIRRIQPTQIVRASSCSLQKSCRLSNSSREQLLVTKKLSAVSEKKEGDGFIGNELTIYNSEYIMTTPLEKQEYIIYKMMYPGLYILAGHPR